MPEFKIKYLGCFNPNEQKWTDFITYCLVNNIEPTSFTDRVRELESEISSDGEEIRDLEDEVTDLESENIQLESRIDKLQSENEKIQEKYSNLAWRAWKND